MKMTRKDHQSKYVESRAILTFGSVWLSFTGLDSSFVASLTRWPLKPASRGFSRHRQLSEWQADVLSVCAKPPKL